LIPGLNRFFRFVPVSVDMDLGLDAGAESRQHPSALARDAAFDMETSN
jgi:hypothetical protein